MKHLLVTTAVTSLFTAIAAHAQDDMRLPHPTTIYLEDSATMSDGHYPPQSNVAAFKEFSLAFTKDAACHGLTLVRRSTQEVGNTEMAKAYWWLHLSPKNQVSNNYGEVSWNMHATSEGTPHDYGWHSGSNATAKQAAHDVCVIASGKAGGTVY